MNNDYILITTAKNEEAKLPLLARSIIGQTKKPVLWFILNDGSLDATDKIIEDLKRDLDWVYSLKLEKSRADLGKHFSKILNKAFRCAISISDKKNIKYEFLGKVDADIILPFNHFESLITEMNKNKKIGVAGPKLDIIKETQINDYTEVQNEDIIKKDDSLLDDPSDAVRLFRKECFVDSWNFDVNFAPDMIATTRAKLQGWKTKRINVVAYHYGETSDAHGSWKGVEFNGFENYYLGIPFSVVFLNSFRLLIKSRHYSALAFVYGYIISFIRRKERLDDKELRHYFKYQYSKEIKNAIVHKVGL